MTLHGRFQRDPAICGGQPFAAASTIEDLPAPAPVPPEVKVP